MKLQRTSAIVEYRLAGRFEALRKRLLEPDLADRLGKPLAYWAYPDDRRLPLAFLDRPLGQLLATPFEELHATPGVGRKKIASLVKLLARAARPDNPHDLAAQATFEQDEEPARSPTDEPGQFNPAAVSEAVWVHWRACVEDHGLEDQALGHFAPSLERLPRVLWETPLSTYTRLSLAEIRELKTHGEKRVAAVLEVFGAIYRVLGRVDARNHLAVRIVPTYIDQMQNWALAALQQTSVPTEADFEQHFLRPAIEQVRIDLGDQIAELAAGRVGLDQRGISVRQEASRLGLTRARVYQLLADVGVAMRVRWPEGLVTMAELYDWMVAHAPIRTRFDRFEAAANLFFPGWRDHVPAIVPAPPAQSTQPNGGFDPQRVAG